MHAFTVHLADDENAMLATLAERCTDATPAAVLAEAGVQMLRSMTGDSFTRATILSAALKRTVEEAEVGVGQATGGQG